MDEQDREQPNPVDPQPTPAVIGYAPIPAKPPLRAWAIVSLLLGIAGLFVWRVTYSVPSLSSLAIGLIAWRLAAKRPHRYGGTGMAVTGVCLGALGMGFTGLAEYVDSYASWNAMRAKQSICQYDLAQIGKAMEVYASRYLGQLPPSVDALVQLSLVQQGAFACPNTDTTMDDLQKDLQSCYVYMKRFTSRPDPQDVLMYELDNHAGRGGSVLFADFKVKWIEPYSRVLELVEQTKARVATTQPEEAPQ